ncbi:hypothetical protein [Pseudogemmobacter sonorensis]|uniref:hypothetical protein n=1 Tax=Pseudogemmobacter sonorensis TaxID=2989681 RepID=UPI0036C5DE60
MERELGTALPRRPGHDVPEGIGAMLSGSVLAFVGPGGNFVRATPDEGQGRGRESVRAPDPALA